MDEINFLILDEVVAIQYDQVRRYGGSYGIRDLNLLISAVERSKATFGGFDLYPDLFSKAAALLHSIVLNHPFVDGNKRTAITATIRFLYINGFLPKMTQKELVDITLNVESKKINIEEIALWLKKHFKKIK
ncbi:MAG TPA: type II toxin-antitoxin system death-on-curing family toxin [Candidatus Saccharimonadales bacterium]|nr:type II toxin-antitoxin system death-on-curing family toxin [Candidatus Saccharimonadales bacterium]